ncbi:MAG: hypothetical protein UR28_C0003G0045 [Candidatus Peregrinibacteria bacterium GW2011_GWF2_33_10]|nr:MAG: hypothetical protein UR28_C0003G0045 [Candidatus Peregrinibacteria bacterium GW2011_GWF2_33_10]OGJ44196.1 MAG: hypothetical protein A2263_04445 [Candidatus Peregrinibacteria bacterium RIFOXYA2_FULL_33_21]OGJ46680.1 MAG: hypothetical protein A2272_04705 [Candidatus Peregrinibacteria bacterium RIFOXYA12_FULL_33_12]
MFLLFLSLTVISCGDSDKEVAKRKMPPKQLKQTQEFNANVEDTQESSGTSSNTDSSSSSETTSNENMTAPTTDIAAIKIEGLNLYIDAVSINYNEKLSDGSYKDYIYAHVCASNIGTGTIGKVTPTITIAINNITQTIPAFTYDLTSKTLQCMNFGQGLELFKLTTGKDYTAIAKVSSPSEDPTLNDNDKTTDFFYEPIDMLTQKVTTNSDLYINKAEKSYGTPTNGTSQTDILLVEVCLDGGNLITKNGNSNYAYTSVDATLNNMPNYISVGFDLNSNHECTAVKYALSEFNVQKGNTYSGELSLRPNTDVNWNETNLENNKYSVTVTY